MQKWLKAAEAIERERIAKRESYMQISKDLKDINRKMDQLNNKLRENKHISKTTITALGEKLRDNDDGISTLKDSLIESGEQNKAWKKQISKKDLEISSI